MQSSLTEVMVFCDERALVRLFNHQKVLKQQAHYHHVGRENHSLFACLLQLEVLNVRKWKASPYDAVRGQ